MMARAIISACDKQQLERVHRLAHLIWPQAFAEILSTEQIAYMLEMMYSVSSLQQQYDKGHLFYIAQLEGNDIGYFSIEHQQSDAIIVTKLHKIYLLPQQQGSGLGKQMLHHAIALARETKAQSFYLNVNRFNKAVMFYQSQGMIIEKEEDIDIGNGYWMNDYVMRLDL